MISSRSKPPPLTVADAPCFSIVCATPCVEPASTANMPFVFGWPTKYDSITGELRGNRGAGGDRVGCDRRVRFERLQRAVDARLDVERARGCDEQRDFAGGHQSRDVFAHLFARDFQVLADVRQPRVAGGVGVVGRGPGSPASAPPPPAR